MGRMNGILIVHCGLHVSLPFKDRKNWVLIMTKCQNPPASDSVARPPSVMKSTIIRSD